MENLLKIFFDNSNFPSFIWNQEGEILFHNQSFANKFLNENFSIWKFLTNQNFKLKSELLKSEDSFVHSNHLLSLKFITNIQIVQESKLFYTICLEMSVDDIQKQSEKLDSANQELHKQKTKLLLRESTLRMQNVVLLQLNKSSSIDSGNLDFALKDISESAVVSLDADRVSIWFYSNDLEFLEAKDIFDRETFQHTKDKKFYKNDFPKFFSFLKEEKSISIENIYKESILSELLPFYFAPRKIFSLLLVPIRIEGKMIGVIIAESEQIKDWSIEEQGFLATLSDVVSRALDAYQTKIARDELKKVNEELENRVQERTKELNEKMNEILTLKLQQDGDYFLTSMILNPLCIDLNTSDKIKTEFFVEHKKQFEFNKKKNHLGGDVVVCGNLKFWDGKDKYLFFVNADAMGKSMQGAGGAIVMGSVINNTIALSARKNRILQISPEEWLTNTYYEVNNIFKSFYGSMLVSALMGIVNESTGEMFYFNADHPFPILFRDNKASLLETDTNVMKLGTDFTNNFEVKRFQFSEGDTLFIGSDGKDDIRISDSYGSKFINEDPYLFLGVVEESQGELNEIVGKLRKKGELTDDLSILKISFLFN
jgi:serine phosphatase RsbU (regulator of sigma subunit)